MRLETDLRTRSRGSRAGASWPLSRWVVREQRTMSGGVDRQYAAAGRQLARGESLPPFGIEWRHARRGTLRFMPHTLKFEEWGIPYESVRRAELISPSDSPFLGGLSVLRLSTDDALYEFSINSFRFARSEFPFAIQRIRQPVVRREVKIVIYLAMCALILGVVLGRRFFGW